MSGPKGGRGSLGAWGMSQLTLGKDELGNIFSSWGWVTPSSLQPTLGHTHGPKTSPLIFSFNDCMSYQDSDQVSRAQNQMLGGLASLLHQGVEGGMSGWLNCRVDISSPSLQRQRTRLDGLSKIYV